MTNVRVWGGGGGGANLGERGVCPGQTGSKLRNDAFLKKFFSCPIFRYREYRNGTTALHIHTHPFSLFLSPENKIQFIHFSSDIDISLSARLVFGVCGNPTLTALVSRQDWTTNTKALFFKRMFR